MMVDHVLIYVFSYWGCGGICLREREHLKWYGVKS